MSMNLVRARIILGVGLAVTILLFLSACQAATPSLVTESPTSLSSSIQEAIATPSSQPALEITPTATLTPEPAVTAELFAALPEETLPPFGPPQVSASEPVVLPVISAENMDQVVSLGMMGRGMIYQVDYSPDGSRIAVMASTGIGLYEAHTLREVYFLETHTDFRRIGVDPAQSSVMEFSPDGHILAVVAESQVLLLDAADGALSGVLEGEGENYQLLSITFSADGKLLAGSEGWSGDMNIWNVTDGKLLQTWQEQPTYRLAFSPDGKLLVSSNGQVHQVADGKLLYNLDEEGYGINLMTFSADGQFLSATGGLEGRLGVWRVSDGKHLYSFETFANAVFSPDGQLITLVTPGGDIQIASAANGNLVSSYKIQHSEFYTERMLGFSPDASLFATAGTGGMITLWDLASGKQVYTHQAHQSDVKQFHFSPDGQIMLTGDDQWLRTWQAADGAPLESLRMGYYAPFVSPDATTLITEPTGYTKGMRVWNSGDGSLRYVLENAVWPVAFSADSSLVAVCERSTTDSGWIRDVISIRNVADGSLLVELKDGDTELDNPTYDLTFSPDGSYLAAVHDYNDLTLWKMPEGKLVYTLSGAETFPFVNVVFSPDGQLLATGNDYHKVLIWRASDGQLLRTLPMEPTQVMGESGQVSSLAFSPDGKLLAATDEGGFYQVWSVEDWETRQHNSDFTNQMYRPSVAMAFSPDGSLLAIGGTGNVISLWRMSDGVLGATLKGHVDGIVRLGFSPEGNWMWSASLDGTLQFWGIPPD